MAAGLGFKDFVTGEVLTAADVDGYLMQGVWVFASAAARDAAVTSPQEGNFAYLKDTNVTTYYTGSAWANLDTTGMTNPMTTTGDTIYSSSGSTPARLGIGSTGQVLTVAGGVPSWASPAGGSGKNWVLKNTGGTSLSGVSSVTISGLTKDNIYIVHNNASSDDSGGLLYLKINNSDTASDYQSMGMAFQTSNSASYMINHDVTNEAYFRIGKAYDNNANGAVTGGALISGAKSTTGIKPIQVTGAINQNSNALGYNYYGLYTVTGTAITSIKLLVYPGAWDTGTLWVYETD